MITIQNVSKVYNKKIKALDNISFEMKKSPFGLVGPNGAGKTTLIKILASLIVNYKGSVKILDTDIKDISIKRKVSFMLDYVKYPPKVKLHKFMKFIANIRGYTGLKGDKEINWALREVGLSDHAEHDIHTLSAGMLRRFNLGCSIIGHPELIIMDEPTNSLDPSWRTKFMNLIQELNGTCNFFISSHSIEEMSNIWDNVVFINRGKIVHQLNELQDIKYLKIKCSDPMIISQFFDVKIDGEWLVILNPPNDAILKINELVKQNKIVIFEMKYDKESIKDTYESVYGEELED